MFTVIVPFTWREGRIVWCRHVGRNTLMGEIGYDLGSFHLGFSFQLPRARWTSLYLGFLKMTLWRF